MNAPASTASSGTTTKVSDKDVDVKAPTTDELKKAAETNYVQQLVPLNTSEDALQAFLQGKIDEETLLQVVSRYGQIHEQWMLGGQLSAYDREIPKGVLILKDQIGDHKAYVEDRENKKKERIDAMKDSLQHLDDSDDVEVANEKRALERDIAIAEGKDQTPKNEKK